MSTCKEIRQQAIVLLNARTPGWTGNWLDALAGCGAEGSALSDQYTTRASSWAVDFAAKHAREIATLSAPETGDASESEDSYDTYLQGRFGADVPVFDRALIGRNVNAERSDEPGDENFSTDESDGWGDDEEYTPLNFNTPSRDPLAGYSTDRGKIYSKEQIAALYPDGYAPGQPSLHHAAIFGPDYAGNPVPPRRIGPVVG